MEGALITLALAAGLEGDAVRREWARIDTIPFDAEHRFMATLNREPCGGRVVLVKGAPERLLSMCASQAQDEEDAPLDPDYWSDRIAEAAAEGERVLGFAAKQVDSSLTELSHQDVEEGLRFLGIVGFIDPPREEAITAVAECRSAGIDVKMITGDHAATAAAIARQLGLSENPVVLTGADLDRHAERELAEVVKRRFSRHEPEHKLRIVRALQSKAVCHDGRRVNDAPSLKQADVGIAMGQKGPRRLRNRRNDPADDNFASIVAAVKEGRTVFDNIRKVIT